MNKPVLVVMAAGMGSRYGGLKQLDPVGNHGQLIIDYSIYDARRAGFETVVFVIKHEIEETFKAAIGDRLSKVIDVRYAFQELGDLPAGYSVPDGRVKPWGTCHAILAARNVVDGPFAVVNADDYYGPEGFKEIYDYLANNPDRPGCYEFAMVGYRLGNTVTENGSVARGICEEDEHNFLVRVTERTRIEAEGADARFTEDGGETWTHLSGDTVVSMNLWGFTRSFMDEALSRFPAFLDKAVVENPLKGEYFLPSVVTQLLDEHKARVKVLRSADKWYGVTYREDRPVVLKAIADMTASGLYPDNLWEV
ncbi:MAG TPA: NTP transferase domain-containing protein [Candidatus Scatomorpha merdigallinarum]|nr:NTP transferase domain-containing protein [Candidatus Scatomorpha merdigallinarum]